MGKCSTCLHVIPTTTDCPGSIGRKRLRNLFINSDARCNVLGPSVQLLGQELNMNGLRKKGNFYPLFFEVERRVKMISRRYVKRKTT